VYKSVHVRYDVHISYLLTHLPRYYSKLVAWCVQCVHIKQKGIIDRSIDCISIGRCGVGAKRVNRKYPLIQNKKKRTNALLHEQHTYNISFTLPTFYKLHRL